MLGYTQASWDDSSGKVKQPLAADKSWDQLHSHERSLALALGWSKKTWENESKKEPQPAVWKKDWRELDTCGTNPIHP